MLDPENLRHTIEVCQTLLADLLLLIYTTLLRWAQSTAQWLRDLKRQHLPEMSDIRLTPRPCQTAVW